MPRFLSQGSVIKLHDRLIQKYGGEPGLRDLLALDSALHQPKLLLRFFRDATLCDLAASYGYHISENQPFFKGNKRTACAAMTSFLEINGLTLTASYDEIREQILRVATKKVDQRKLADWLSSNTRKL